MPELFLTTKLPALRHFPPAENDTGTALWYLPRRQPASMGPQQSRMAQRLVRAISTLPHIVFEAAEAMASWSGGCAVLYCAVPPPALSVFPSPQR